MYWKFLPVRELISVLVFVAVIGGLFFNSYDKQKPSEDDVKITGVVKFPVSSWSPRFEDCISPTPMIESDGKTYYLIGLCPSNVVDSVWKGLVSKDYPLDLYGKEATITGIIMEKELDVPLSKEINPPTVKRMFSVIVVKNIEIIK